MSRLSSPPTNHHRTQTPVSVATSDTTYHSFYDVELFEPASPVTTLRNSLRRDEQFAPKPMVRHDSGYESMYSGSSRGHGSRTANRNAPQTQQQKRPVIQRAAKSTPASYPGPRSGNCTRMAMPKQHQSHSYYCFPSPEAITDPEETAKDTDQTYHPPPPQTTHYWMSDHTRRLEYAAIDAASRGIKGWVIKHIPDCFVPKDNRRLTFDDDTGSVRRYRLELESDELSLKKGKCKSKKWRWPFRR